MDGFVEHEVEPERVCRAWVHRRHDQVGRLRLVAGARADAVRSPTGSTGYGQKFCDDIKNQWGGKPFIDLVAGLEFVKEAFPEIDGERTAMLGASYGGTSSPCSP